MTAVAPGVGVPRTEALAQQRFLKCPNVTVLKQISLKSLKLVLLRKTIKVPRICNRKTKLLIQFHTKKTNPIGRAHTRTRARLHTRTIDMCLVYSTCVFLGNTSLNCLYQQFQ